MVDNLIESKKSKREKKEKDQEKIKIVIKISRYLRQREGQMDRQTEKSFCLFYLVCKVISNWQICL